MHDDITDVPGIRVGHYTDLAASTGCSVVVCESAAVGGVDVRGGAPATRETDLLSPLCLVDEVHAVLLTGGSAFGLDAASGVVRYLEEQGIGFDTGIARVPIVPGAAIFDLAVGNANVRPDAQAGYVASQQARGGPIAQGNVGAGTGATIGKLLGPTLATKGGLGSASMELLGGTIVGALVVVNALGDIYDHQTAQMIAGAQRPPVGQQHPTPNPFGNTTIAVIATNAALNKVEATKVAQMAHDGMAQAIRPAHTMFDGDLIFALSLGTQREQHDTATTAQRVNAIGAAAAHTLARAIVKAVHAASNTQDVAANS